MNSTAFYPGSFDPLTLGHLDIIRRALRICDRLIIGVGVHHGKKAMFSSDERLAMLERQKADLIGEGMEADRLAIVGFDNLVVEAARAHGARLIIRGLRDGGDLDYEMRMAAMNAGLAGDIETVFLASSPELRHIAASLVRQIALMGGDVRGFVPVHVAQMLVKQAEKR